MGKLLLLSVVFALSLSSIVGYKNRSILFNEFKDKTKSFNDLNEWRIKLKNDFKQNVEKLTENVKNAVISKADEELKKNWTVISSMDYLDYKLTGRRNYEAITFERNRRLQTFVMAAIITKEAKYLDQAANGLWLTLEESTWVWPAHLDQWKTPRGLPDPTIPYVDLGVGERSAYVAWLGFILGKKSE